MGGLAEMLLEKVKNALRITVPHMDEELLDIINACEQDLTFAGVCNVIASDPSIIRAVVLYAKANFSFSADGHRFHQQYDSLKNLLRLSGRRGDADV